MGKTGKILPIETKLCHLKGLLFLMVLPEKKIMAAPLQLVCMLIRIQPANLVT